MDILVINAQTYEEMQKALTVFSRTVKQLCGHQNSVNDWLDNQDVCQLLKVSKRTLQYYREKGILPYSQIGHKCYYKKSDIHTLLNNSTKNK